VTGAELNLCHVSKVVDPDSIGCLDPYPGSGSRVKKKKKENYEKNNKTIINKEKIYTFRINFFILFFSLTFLFQFLPTQYTFSEPHQNEIMMRL
jgi:hypothetical protein